MRLTTDNAGASTNRRRLGSLAVVLGLFLFASGCASWNSIREHHTPLVGRFWHHKAEPGPDPGYDLYADSVAAARTKATKEAVPSSRPAEARDKDRAVHTPSDD